MASSVEAAPAAAAIRNPAEARLVFVCGLHRSGTTFLHDLLATSPDIAGFRDTGIYAHEGQHVQSVYPIEDRFGGPGRVAFHLPGPITPQSPLVTPENASRLLAEWAPYWDADRPILLEKTPANLLWAPFLQALFPQAAFIVMTRHPIATMLATQKWSHTSLFALFEHWLRAHETFRRDRPQLRRVLSVSYEDLATAPEAFLARVTAFLEIAPWTPPLKPARDLNDNYFAGWRRLIEEPRDSEKRVGTLIERLYRRLIREAHLRVNTGYLAIDQRAEAHDAIAAFEDRVAAFGYSLSDLSRWPRDPMAD